MRRDDNRDARQRRGIIDGKGSASDRIDEPDDGVVAFDPGFGRLAPRTGAASLRSVWNGFLWVLKKQRLRILPVGSTRMCAAVSTMPLLRNRAPEPSEGVGDRQPTNPQTLRIGRTP